MRLWSIGAIWLAIMLAHVTFQVALTCRRHTLRLQLLASAPSTNMHVMRDGKLQKQESPYLVPGDIVMLVPYIIVPCDCTLLQGEVTVDETPVIEESSGGSVRIKKHAFGPEAVAFAHTSSVLSGSLVLEASRSANVGAVAIVQATGGATQQANTVRQAIEKFDTESETPARLQSVYSVAVAYLIGFVCVAAGNVYSAGFKYGTALKIFKHDCLLVATFHPLLVVVGMAFAARQFFSSSAIGSLTLPSCAVDRKRVRRYQDCVTRKLLNRPGPVDVNYESSILAESKELRKTFEGPCGMEDV